MDLSKYWDERISKLKLLGTGDTSLHPKVNEMVKKIKVKDIKSMVEFRGKTVLDAGCGTGLYSRFAKEMAASKVFALDFAPSSVKMAKSEGVDVIVASITNIPFSDNYFDIVMCISVLYHIIDDKLWEMAIGEISRVLKLKGVALLQIENRETFLTSKTYRGRPLDIYMKKFYEMDLKLLDMKYVYSPPKTKLLRLVAKYIPSFGKIMVKRRKENILITLKKVI